VSLYLGIDYRRGTLPRVMEDFIESVLQKGTM